VFITEKPPGLLSTFKVMVLVPDEAFINGAVPLSEARFYMAASINADQFDLSRSRNGAIQHPCRPGWVLDTAKMD